MKPIRLLAACIHLEGLVLSIDSVVMRVYPTFLILQVVQVSIGTQNPKEDWLV